MSTTKYITYIYKITTKEDKLRLFIGSTKEKLQTLLLFFIKNLNTNHKNNLYEWIRPLNKSNLKIKLIKSYPVSNKDEQKKREQYWIKKYKTYGYDVIHNPLRKTETKEEKGKIYVCIENVTMSEVLKKYGDKIVYISKNNFTSNNFNNFNNFNTLQNNTIPSRPQRSPQSPITIMNKKSKSPEPLPVTSGNGYLNELKNLLSKRKSSNLSIMELTKKNKTNNPISTPNKKTSKKKSKKTVITPTNNVRLGGHKVLAELKDKIKKIE